MGVAWDRLRSEPSCPWRFFSCRILITGSVGAFSDGVFLALERRFGQAERPLPPIEDMAWALPYGVVLLAVALGRRILAFVTASLAALGLVAALATIDRQPSYLALWNSARFLPIFTILAGCVLLLRRPRRALANQTSAGLSSCSACWRRLDWCSFRFPRPSISVTQRRFCFLRRSR